MKTVQNLAIDDYCERYLDVLETLYGDFNLHPAQSIEEICEEWNNQFAAGKRVETEHPRDIVDWEDSYIKVLESIYGTILIQPCPDIEETNQEWINLFMTDRNESSCNQQLA